MTPIEPAAAAVLVAAVALVTVTPFVAVPAGLLAAVCVLSTDVSPSTAVALAASGVVLGRLSLALLARRRRSVPVSPEAAARNDMLRNALTANGRYRAFSFLAGAAPVLPAHYVFPLLGRMRAPLRYALLGSFVGQLPLIAFTGWLTAVVARALTPGERQAGMFATILALVWAATSIVNRVDWPHLRSTGQLRAREKGLGTAGLSGGAVMSGFPFPPGVDIPGVPGVPGDERDMIDVEAVEDDGDDEGQEDGAGPPPALPPAGGAPA